MSSADLPEQQSRFLLAPYYGSRRSRARETWGRLVLPLLVVLCLLYGMMFGLWGPFLLALFPIPLVVLAAVAVWALPDMKVAPTGTLNGLFFTFFLALILWPNYLAIALPGLPWITMIRLVGAPMTAIFLICLSISPSVRSELRAALQAAPAMWMLLTAFAVVQLITVAFSNHPGGSLQKVINADINWTCIFFVSCLLFLKTGRARLWAALLCMTLAPICLIVFKEHADSQLPWANHIPSFLKVNDESVQRILAGARRDGGEYRVQSTFSTPLGLAEYIALTVPFLLHFIASPVRLVWRILAMAVLPVAIYVVLLTDSRLGLIGCIVGVLLYTLLWGVHWWRTRRENLIGPAVVLAYPALVAIAFASTLFIGRIRERIWGSGQYEASNEGRSEMYRVGIPMVLKHPWGYGPGRGAETLGITNPSGVLTIDTYYLLIGMEYGIIGFLFYYGMLIAGIWYAARRGVAVDDRHSELMLLMPLTVSLTNFFIIKSVFSNDDNHPLVFMMLGMVAALCLRMLRRGPANDAPAA